MNTWISYWYSRRFRLRLEAPNCCLVLENFLEAASVARRFIVKTNVPNGKNILLLPRSFEFVENKTTTEKDERFSWRDSIPRPKDDSTIVLSFGWANAFGNFYEVYREGHFWFSCHGHTIPVTWLCTVQSLRRFSFPNVSSHRAYHTILSYCAKLLQ